MEEIKKMNIFEKMSNITNEIEIVRKNLKVGTGSSQYSAVAEKDVLDAVKDIEYKYRVYSYPKERELVDNQILNKKVVDKNGVEKELSTFYSKIKTIYTFINIDNPSESIDTIVFSEGIDTADKGSGKGMTYADKYALLKAYKIETGEDPDKTPSPTENDEVTLTLEEAKENVINFGKYKNKKYYEVYEEDRNYLVYITSGDNPNYLAKAHLELFDNIPINKLNILLNETKVPKESLLKRVEKNKLDELTEEEIKEAIDILEDYKKQQEEKINKSKENVEKMIPKNMLEQAEKELESESK